MHLPNRWTNKEGWLFHIKDSGIMRLIVEHIRNDDEVPLEKLEEMEFRREWMQDDGEGNPPNYDLLKSLADELQYKIENGEFKPSFIERRVYLKMIFYVLVKMKQDSAYRERMGAWLSVTMLDPAKWQACKSREDRVLYFWKLHKWWDENDQRARTKPWIDALIKEFIKRYDSSDFVEECTNWFYNALIERRKEWVIDVSYDPKNWYPVGRGYVQNKIRGGMG